MNYDEITCNNAAEKLMELCKNGELSWKEVAFECIEQASEDECESVCSVLGLGTENEYYDKEGNWDPIEEDNEEEEAPAIPETIDQLIAKIAEIRGKIDNVAKSVAEIQTYCANHTDQRDINDMTVDLNSGIQDAIEALDDILTVSNDQKKENKKAAIDAIGQQI